MKSNTDKFMTKIIKINESKIDINKIKEAAIQIKRGNLVIFPTETVYGIGADAFNSKACKKIFKVKKRAADNPLIVHICDLKQLNKIAFVDDKTLEKIRILWPGPVTFILKRKSLPKVVTAGLDTVAVRMPSNKIALSLIKELGRPIAAPSANISTFPSSTEVSHAVYDFRGKVSMIIDGGKSRFGIESTVVDISRKRYRLLRPGAFDVDELSKVLGKITVPKDINKTIKNGKALSPGMKYRHYSPRKSLFLFDDFRDMEKAAAYLSVKKAKFAVICPKEYLSNFKGMKVIVLGKLSEPQSITRNLFSSFRKLDQIDVDFGLISDMKLDKFDLAVKNRLLKASGDNKVSSLSEFKKLINI